MTTIAVPIIDRRFFNFSVSRLDSAREPGIGAGSIVTFVDMMRPLSLSMETAIPVPLAEWTFEPMPTAALNSL